MGLPAMPLAEIMRRTATLKEQRKERMANLIREVGHGDFWTGLRSLQILRMLGRMKAQGSTRRTSPESWTCPTPS